MANWKTFRITHYTEYSNDIIIYIDGEVDYRDARGESRIILDKCFRSSSLRENKYVEVDLDEIRKWSWKETIFSTYVVRIASSEVARTAATRDAMIRTSSVNPTALTITREGMDRVDRNEQNEFEYKMEDAGGNKHQWIYRKR